MVPEIEISRTLLLCCCSMYKLYDAFFPTLPHPPKFTAESFRIEYDVIWKWYDTPWWKKLKESLPNGHIAKQCGGTLNNTHLVGFGYFWLLGLHQWPCSSVQFSHSVVSNSLQPRGLQHTRPPYPSLTPGVNSNSCPLSWWCHPTISSSVIPFSFHLQSFPASESFQMSQFFASDGQSIGASASASDLPMNIQNFNEWI